MRVAIFSQWKIFLYILALMTFMTLISHGTLDMYPTFLQRYWHFGPSKRAIISAIGSVSLDVAPGEFLAIVGPSGCGKSTLLQVIAGLMMPSAGKVTLGAQDVTGEPAHMVYLFQQYSKSLLPWMTVANNVMFAFSHRIKLSNAAAQFLRWARA